DGEQVQDRVGGPAERHGHGDGVLERLLGHDVACGDALFEHGDHRLAGQVRIVVTTPVRGRGSGGTGQAHPHRFSDRGHGVGREHTAAGAFTGADGTFDPVQVVVAHPAGLAGPDTLEGVDECHVLFGAVGQLHPTECDGAREHEDGGQTQAGGHHVHAGQCFVAACEQDRPVQLLRTHDRFDGVGDHLTRDEGEVHAVVAHGDAVGDRDRAELQWVATAGVHTSLRGAGQAVQGEVAGGDLVPRTGNADERLVPVTVTHADRAEHAPAGGCFDAVGDDAATGLWVDVHV